MRKITIMIDTDGTVSILEQPRADMDDETRAFYTGVKNVEDLKEILSMYIGSFLGNEDLGGDKNGTK